MGGIWGSQKAKNPETDFTRLFRPKGSAGAFDAAAWEARLVQLAVEHFKKDHQIDLTKESLAMTRLSDAAVRVRQELTQATSTKLHLPFLSADRSGPKHLDWEISRSIDQELA